MLRWNCIRARTRLLLLTAIIFASALSGNAAVAESCTEGSFPSTFALIQKKIFENHGCTDSVCHGAAKSGGLDLREGSASDRLVDVDATSVPGLKRVFAGQKTSSLLWLNLAAKTDPSEWKAPLRAMPPDPLPALSSDELEAMRLWIEKGAP